MPRKPIVRSNEHFYHLTARSNNKENFYVSKDRIWHLFTLYLRCLQVEYELKIAAFVLMDNHFHLLLRSPEEDIDRIMYFLMKKLSLQIRKESGRINRVFGGRYKGCLVTEESYLFNVYKYIYRNPIRAGLCNKIEEYRYSSWAPHPVSLETLFFKERKTAGELRWLNAEYDLKQSQGIQRSLKRTVFQIPGDWRGEQVSDWMRRY